MRTKKPEIPSAEKFNQSNETPFLFGEPAGFGQHAEVFESKQDKNKLIKKLKIRVPDDMAPLITGDYDEQLFRKHYQKNFRMIKEKFGQYLPEMQLVLGKAEAGHITGYLVTDRIVEEERNSEAKLKSLDETLAALVSYYISEYENRRTPGPIIRPVRISVPDFVGPNDMMYGYTKTRAQPQWFFPDIYPMLEFLPSEFSYAIKEKFHAYPNHPFKKAEQKLQSMQNYIDDEKTYYDATSF